MADIVGVVGAYPHTDALFEKTFTLSSGEAVETRPYSFVAGGAAAVAARVVRELEGFDFDFAELPVVNYLSSKEHGAKYTALPVFFTRRFVQNMLIVNQDVINEPKDLEGKRVGMIYYGHSDSTWVRGILAEHYGVDLSKITWVTAAEEQVAKAVLPPNVVHIPRTSVDQMLVNGELAAQITNPVHVQNVAVGPQIGPMWPDTAKVDEEWYAATGHLPILHTLIVKNQLLEAIPNLGEELYAAFLATRDEAVAAVEAGRSVPEEDLRRAMSSGFPTTTHANSPRPYLPADPIPYGVEANRENLETLIRMARNMHIIDWNPPLNSLFAVK